MELRWITTGRLFKLIQCRTWKCYATVNRAKDINVITFHAHFSGVFADVSGKFVRVSATTCEATMTGKKTNKTQNITVPYMTVNTFKQSQFGSSNDDGRKARAKKSCHKHSNERICLLLWPLFTWEMWCDTYPIGDLDVHFRSFSNQGILSIM